MTNKKCYRRKLTKATIGFTRDARQVDGVSRNCRDCKRVHYKTGIHKRILRVYNISLALAVYIMKPEKITV